MEKPQKVDELRRHSQRINAAQKRKTLALCRIQCLLAAIVKSIRSRFQKLFPETRAPSQAYKRKHGKQSVRYMQNGFTYHAGTVKLAKQKTSLNIRISKPLPSGNPSSVTVSKDSANRYFISLLFAEEIPKLPLRQETVGLDMGLKTAITTSSGEKIENPRPLQKKLKRLKLYARRLAKKRKGSNNRSKQRKRLSRLHSKIADYRKDYYHKVTTKIIRENQVIAVEDLNIKQMQKNKQLARSVGDVGMRQVLSFLEYKAKWYGRQFIRIDRWFPSSKTCSNCQSIQDRMSLGVRTWKCSQCHAKHDRDINAAKNILRAACESMQCEFEKLTTVGLAGS